MLKRIVIVIPSLNPDEKLRQTVEGLRAVGFSRFVLVDDGSDLAHKKFFPSLQEDGIVLLEHVVNRGKGAALKTAFQYILKDKKDTAGVITVDGDGQHHPEDVYACAKEFLNVPDAVVLGCRDFSGKDVPARSRFGNRTTSLVFRALCGMHISDTQTGLRALPFSALPLLLTVRGEHFEYETNMLLKLKQNGISMREVKIRTVYIEHNASSHFKPIRDSIRVYGFLLTFLCSSLMACAVDLVVFYLLRRLLGGLFGDWSILAATAGARVVSSLTNFQINRQRVFESKQKTWKTLCKYYTLVLPQMLISAGLVSLLSACLGGNSETDTLLKLLVDTLLFFVSYRIQQSWVFAEKSKAKPARREKKPLTAGKVIRRILLSVFSLFMAVLMAVYAALFVVAHGPSESLRNMLVLSAKQASATKWVPSLFLSKGQIEEILKNSEKITTNTLAANTYATDVSADEWADAKDGMKLEFITQPKFKAYLLLVRDPKRVTVGVSSAHFETASEGKRIFDLADQYHAVAAINGGEFIDTGGRGNGARPMGLTYAGGKKVWSDGLKRTFIGFDSNDRLVCREGMTAAEADALGIRDAISFQNGNVLIEQSGDEIQLHYSNDNTGTAQRTAIGQRADGTVLLLVTDGRSASSIGATRNDVIDVLVNYGAVSAGMLDGGSSAMMYYRDYYNKYSVDTSALDVYQKQGLVNRYKAFTKPRRIPTYFIVTGE
ncbi:MAG: phosphodiester glycosidase family protein [Clostridia bacterium]|nr:phosphodiester glycosidase family protein [Clostridia bacterium]